MPTSRRMLDQIIRHRIDLQRFARREASIVLDLMGREDASLIQMLRTRLPRTGPDLSGLRGEVRSMRSTGFARVRATLGKDLFALARVEGAAIERMAVTALRIPSVFNPVRDAQLRNAVSERVFGGGARGAGRTMEGWFATIAEADQRRLFGALDIGVRRRETIDDQIRRIAGTRDAGYADGVLAVSRRQAESLTRTATNHAANAAQAEWSKANADVVTGMEQVEVLDDRTCGECEELNGRIWDLDSEGRLPADCELPVHLNCRGSLVPDFNLEAIADKVPDQVDDQQERAA